VDPDSSPREAPAGRTPRVAPAIGLSRDRVYSPELEAVRGLAITLVVLYHGMGMVLAARTRAPGAPLAGSLALDLTLDTSPAGALVYGGHTGVSLFFVLSAFLLSRPFIRAHATGGHVSSAEFFRRRVLRIMPAYAAAVVVGVVATSQDAQELLRVVPYLLFLNSIPDCVSPVLPYSGVWWSLATEVQFYLVLPAAFWLARTRLGGLLVVAALVGYGVAYLTVTIGGQPVTGSMVDEVVLRHSLLGRAPAFGAGIGAAWLDARIPVSSRDAARRGARRDIAVWGGSLVLLGCLLGVGTLLREVLRNGYYAAELGAHYWHVAEALLWAAYVLAIRRGAGPVRAILSCRPLQWLGVISYSLYLVHFSVIWGLLSIPSVESIMRKDGSLATALAFTGVASACSVALSIVAYAAIERPFLRLKAARGARSVASNGGRPVSTP
jgi:peptidoglycan/LPS O-acetylase OafA/YrhL